VSASEGHRAEPPRSSSFETIRYELVDDATIARIVMNRPDAANAQNRKMTYELNDAFTAAARDDRVKVIVLSGEGKHFSAGHDLRDTGPVEVEPIGVWGSWDRPAAEGYMAYEEEVYLHMCRRWYDIPKPTIAQVHGKVIAGGLMLAWVCDLIVASDDTVFSDPVVGFGVNGVEWFAHPWELGLRKAKELLFTADEITAEEARQLGMVNRVVARPDLEDTVLAMARRIAAKPSFGLKLAKQACNQARDAQGFWTAQQAAFGLQHLGHANNRERFGLPIDPSGLGPRGAAATEQAPSRDSGASETTN
jgi:enoyl-CoA hydratase